ncbi:mas-related G-protein coupled receptor member X1-like [Macrotis lagotis]|uniref:mas-related G-protein coupled receptor member X1-like n=1 Tax=Macrotis lagotis TaxID=92651 RepID=UPI003D6879AF
MTASPTPEQLEYIQDNATEPSPDGTEKLTLDDWMRFPSLLVSLVGLVGNSLVLWLLGFRIPRNPFSVYILNLAAADALFLGNTFGSIISDYVSYSEFLSLVLTYLTYTFYTAGLSLLAAISTERCLAVLFPIWCRCHRPKHASASVCAAIWAVVALLWGTDVFFCYYVINDGFCKKVVTIELGWLTLVTPVLCLSSLALLLRVQCGSRRRQPPRLYLLVLLIVLVFLLCGVPMGVLDFLYIYHNFPVPFYLPRLLACVNSSANPFIYFFLGRQKHKRRRESLRVILQRALGDKQDSGAWREGRPPHTHHDSEMTT